MKRLTKLLIVIFLGVAAPTWAAAPDLLPPLSMTVDENTQVSATGLDFIEHPKSGPVNFSPNNYDVHLPGNVTLAVQDVVPYMGVRPPLSDCKALAQVIYDAAKPAYELVVNFLTKLIGLPLQPTKDPTVIYDGMFKMCNAIDAKQKEFLFSSNPVVRQNVADVRNTSSNSTNVIFSGEALAPYSGGFPLAIASYAGTVIGDLATGSKDLWNDAIILAGYEPVITPGILATPTLTSSLAMYRFLPNPAGNTALQFSGYSSAWLDKAAKDNPTCFDVTDPQKPTLLPYDALIKNGCVGERNPTGIVSLNFFNHANSKMKDLVVVSRAPFGDPKSLATKVGYITIYKRNEGLPAPADTSLFQDIWQFDRSVTHSGTGIPEPYGIAVLRNWDPANNKMTEGVVVASNQLFGAMQFGSQYYVYYFANGMAEPKVISVGEGFDPEMPGLGGFGPYRVYSDDVNSDNCGDILLTRAKIDPKGTNIQFADYFDVHLQVKDAAGQCTGDFDKKGNKYKIPALDPQKKPQISSLAIADFNKDGSNDVMAADFTIYLNKTSGARENVVHFLEYKGGIFNTIQPPRYVVTTKGHASDVGPIDIKADAYANLGVVIGKPMKFELVTLKEDVVVTSDVCGVGGQKYEASWLDIDTAPGVKNDTDNDGIPDCVVYLSGGNPTTGNCKMYCDNCSGYFKPNACKADPSKCANPDQKDTDGDKTGDSCDAFPNDDTQSSLGIKPIPLAKTKKPLREDKVMYATDQPAIANYDELKTVAVPASEDNGHEVTILLNKTIVKDTKKQCTNGDLACICDQNPGLLACKCLKDPQAPECKTDPTAQPTCAVDVCRGDLTAPFPRMCDYIRPFNDQIRKCTGLNSDFLIPVEGAQYHVSCTMPNTPALDLGNGQAYTRIYKTGQLPKNYFKDWHKPVADDNILAKPVLLNPPAKAADGTDLDISPLPNPTFDADPLLSVVPNATLNQAPGIAQIDGIMEIQTNLVDMSNVAGAGKAAPGGAAAKVLSLDVKGFSSPAGCQWAGPDCPKPMPNPPSAQEFVNVICAKAKEAESAGKAVTVDTVNEAFNSMNVGSAFLHQKLVIPGAQGAVVIPLQNTMGSMSAEGGCGCSITATSTLHNTALPLLMALSALGGMAFLRRNTAKKR